MNKRAIMSDESADIMRVIERETERFVSGDFEGWAACWVHDPRTREVCFSSTGGVTVVEGWDAIEAYMRDVFRSGAICDIVAFHRHNISLSINGDVAIVTFDGESRQSDGRVERTFETRFLERERGSWRILYSSFVLRGHQMDDVHRISIDAKGKVLCAQDEALAVLKGHPGLQISNGRLRATKPDWDKVLQSGIACAAQQHRYFQQYRYAKQSGQSFRLPIVLGETDEGGVAFCTLFARDEMTFVQMQGDRDLSERLNVAKAIYGLSDGQLSLALRIVSGDSLGAAADSLGISINTVRTHLSRIYAKTGVSSQTALVRVLLSVG